MAFLAADVTLSKFVLIVVLGFSTVVLRMAQLPTVEAWFVGFQLDFSFL